MSGLLPLDRICGLNEEIEYGPGQVKRFGDMTASDLRSALVWAVTVDENECEWHGMYRGSCPGCEAHRP